MTQQLYLEDSYLKECDATVTTVRGDNGEFVVLDKTILYAQGGGQPFDTGKLVRKSDNAEFKVVSVKKKDGEINHHVEGDAQLAVGDEVTVSVDWDRRYKLMRTHTATHVLAAFLHKEAGAMITGNQLETEKTRIDFSLENFDREKLAEYVAKANAAMKESHEVKVYFLDKDADVEQFMKLAKGLPPNLTKIRIVEIGTLDKQPDGGTHVKNTTEVGDIEILKCENKGKSNRRLYFKLKQ